MLNDTCMPAPVTTQLSEPCHKLCKHGSEVTAREIPSYVCVYTCTTHTTCVHMHYSCYMCTHALLMLHVYTCTTHATCVHMHYSCYMCTHALLMLHVYTCTTHATCVHMHYSCYMCTHALLILHVYTTHSLCFFLHFSSSFKTIDEFLQGHSLCYHWA